jgi:hypothetical protein
VAAAGDTTQVARAKELLAQTRRGLYEILADEPGEHSIRHERSGLV